MTRKSALSAQDVQRIEAGGMSLDRVLAQLDLFRKGSFPVRLNRPCTMNDGIRTLSDEKRRECLRLYDEAVSRGRIMKFVPASGAASRMFQDWCGIYQAGGFGSREQALEFARDVRKFAFFSDLTAVLARDGLSFDKLVEEERYAEILAYILTSKGLNYSSLPKALLKFHAYPRRSRTALEEHLVEAALYARDRQNICRLHITVSEEHQSIVNDHLSGIKPSYEARLGVRFMASVSAQKSSTDTISVDLENQMLRDETGGLVFRPGGHGALLDNLCVSDGDILMVKNIDNVVPDRLKEETAFYKKVLGGCLVLLQEECFRHLESFFGPVGDDILSKAEAFCIEELDIVFPAGFESWPGKEKKDYLTGKLNRPIRVCGMVKNEGEPGGGPFWVDEEDGTQSLQIVEEAQIDSGSGKQREIWRSSSHFNPVDLACGIRDFRSMKFNLRDFVDEKTYLISRKYQDGREMKALELPGLWNGSMAQWNTVFIEVPIETFNPVKTVYDLLRPQHLPD